MKTLCTHRHAHWKHAALGIIGNKKSMFWTSWGTPHMTQVMEPLEWHSNWVHGTFRGRRKAARKSSEGCRNQSWHGCVTGGFCWHGCTTWFSLLLLKKCSQGCTWLMLPKPWINMTHLEKQAVLVQAVASSIILTWPGVEWRQVRHWLVRTWSTSFTIESTLKFSLTSRGSLKTNSLPELWDLLATTSHCARSGMAMKSWCHDAVMSQADLLVASIWCEIIITITWWSSKEPRTPFTFLLVAMLAKESMINDGPGLKSNDAWNAEVFL